MDPRFDRAHGAMAGLIYGRSLGVDTSSEESTNAASVCKAILELLTVDKSAEPPTLPSLLAPTKRPYALLPRGRCSGESRRCRFIAGGARRVEPGA